LTSESLQGGLEGEAFAGRGVEGPEQGVDARLIDECIRFARRRGYRTTTRWSKDVL